MRLYIGSVRIPLRLWRIMGARIEAEIVETGRTVPPLVRITIMPTGRQRLASRFGPLTPWMDRPIWRIG